MMKPPAGFVRRMAKLAVAALMLAAVTAAFFGVRECAVAAKVQFVPALLALDAAAFSRKHPEESITIVECEKDSAAALQALADNLSFVNTSSARQGTVEVVDGKKLVYTAPVKAGVILIIR